MEKKISDRGCAAPAPQIQEWICHRSGLKTSHLIWQRAFGKGNPLGDPLLVGVIKEPSGL